MRFPFIAVILSLVICTFMTDLGRGANRICRSSFGLASIWSCSLRASWPCLDVLVPCKMEGATFWKRRRLGSPSGLIPEAFSSAVTPSPGRPGVVCSGRRLLGWLLLLLGWLNGGARVSWESSWACWARFSSGESSLRLNADRIKPGAVSLPLRPFYPRGVPRRSWTRRLQFRLLLLGQGAPLARWLLAYRLALFLASRVGFSNPHHPQEFKILRRDLHN